MTDGNRSTLSGIAESWRDAIRDVVLIVLSLLIAFSLDAWWDSRQDRLKESRLLSDLESEFDGARAEFDQTQAYHRAKVAALNELLSVIGRPLTVSHDSVTALWRQTLGSRTFDPPMGTVESIITSGNLDLIRDDTLARLIAGWKSRVDNLAKAEENIRVVYRDEILPWLQDRTPMPHGSSVGRVFQPNPAVILNDYAFDNRLRWIAVQTNLILTESGPVSATIDSILQRARSANTRR